MRTQKTYKGSVRLYKLHASGEFHGALFDPKNYIISKVQRKPRDWVYEIEFRDLKDGSQKHLLWLGKRVTPFM